MHDGWPFHWAFQSVSVRPPGVHLTLLCAVSLHLTIPYFLMALYSLFSHPFLASSAKSGVGKLPPVGTTLPPIFATGIHPTPFSHVLSMAAFQSGTDEQLLQRPLWSAKLRLFTLRPFTEKVLPALL